MTDFRRTSGMLAMILVCSLSCLGQATAFTPGTLDPTRNLRMTSGSVIVVAPLPEQYIWLQGTPPSNVDQSPHPPKTVYFRRTFSLRHVPRETTLYFAGPRIVAIYLNGQNILDASRDPNTVFGFPVFAVDIGRILRQDGNTLAIRMVQTSTEATAFVLKIVPAARGIDCPPLLVTDERWKGTDSRYKGWERADFKDESWRKAESFGPINGNVDYLQWYGDSGLYDWPGYIGVSSFLARYPLPALKVESVIQATSKLQNIAALTDLSEIPRSKEFKVTLAAPILIEQNAPSIVLDFGKEVTGWLELVSDSEIPATITIQYGESKDEMENGPYLGIDPLYVPPMGTAHGPKSAFRYAKVQFLAASAPIQFKSIRLNGIYYPVKYQGSFSSSDDLLNKIWEVGAYTAHLCMQDDIWDAPKRDRARWAGDLDVTGDVIDSVFTDHFLMQDTMTRLIGPEPVKEHVNEIPGYSAFWVMEMRDYVWHTGQTEYLAQLHDRLVQLLNYLEKDLGPDHLFSNLHKEWPFVDWSPYLDQDTPEARKATDFEFYAAFTRGAEMLRQLGDSRSAQHFDQVGAAMKQAAQSSYLDAQTGTFGPRWQTNAMAIYSGIADPAQYGAIWDQVLSKVGTPFYNALIISPYYNYYVITAMAESDHRKEALEWIRRYWGGMIDEGATSFWEAYDPSWPKDNFHVSLQADGTTGYRTSLAHGWSSGPTAWMMEQILGIDPTAEGFRTVTIRPDLAGLAWAKGAEPTPHGLIRIDLRAGAEGSISIRLDLPEGIKATVLAPVYRPAAQILINGKPVRGQSAEDGHRIAIEIDHGGHFLITG